MTASPKGILVSSSSSTSSNSSTSTSTNNNNNNITTVSSSLDNNILHRDKNISNDNNNNYCCGISTTGTTTTIITSTPITTTTRKRRSTVVSAALSFPSWLLINPSSYHHTNNNSSSTINHQHSTTTTTPSNPNKVGHHQSNSIINNSITSPLSSTYNMTTINSTMISSTTTTATTILKIYRTIYKVLLGLIFFILVLLQFHSGQVTITNFTQSLLLSSSLSTPSDYYNYNFMENKDIIGVENSNNKNFIRSSSNIGSSTSNSITDSKKDDDENDHDAVLISHKTIIQTTTNQEHIIPSSSNEQQQPQQQSDSKEESVAVDEHDDSDRQISSDQNSVIVVEDDTIERPYDNEEDPSDSDGGVITAQPSSTVVTIIDGYKRPNEWKVFPRWNTTTGIPIQPLIDFIYGVAYDNTTTITTQTIRNMFPETLYVFDVTGVYYSHTIRNRTHKTFIGDRVKPSEMIMKLAHEILIQHMKTVQTLQNDYKKQFSGITSVLLGRNNNINNTIMEASKSFKAQRRKISTMEQKWHHLQDLMLQKGSFPFLAWYGDFTGCNYRNWKRNTNNVVVDHKDIDTSTTTRRRRLATSSSVVEVDDDTVTTTSDDTYESIPLFTTCAQIKCNHAFPLPTYKTIQGSLTTTFQWKKQMQVYHEEYASDLEQKIPKLVWRGSLTGDIQNYTNIRWLLCKYVTEAPDEEKQYYDIGLTKIPSRHDKVPLNLTIVGDLIKGIFPMAAFQNYRAILDIDGNSWSSRFGSLLCYHSVILKVEPMYVDYFHYTSLIPNVHYVPVHYNLSNLYSQTLYVMDPNNAKDVQRIIRNANAWCQKHMVYNKIASDYLTIFDQYIEYLNIATTDGTVEMNWKTIWNHHKEHNIFPNKEVFNMLPVK